MLATNVPFFIFKSFNGISIAALFSLISKVISSTLFSSLYNKLIVELRISVLDLTTLIIISEITFLGTTVEVPVLLSNIGSNKVLFIFVINLASVIEFTNIEITAFSSSLSVIITTAS